MFLRLGCRVPYRVQIESGGTSGVTITPTRLIAADIYRSGDEKSLMGTQFLLPGVRLQPRKSLLHDVIGILRRYPMATHDRPHLPEYL